MSEQLKLVFDLKEKEKQALAAQAVEDSQAVPVQGLAEMPSVSLALIQKRRNAHLDIIKRVDAEVEKANAAIDTLMERVNRLEKARDASQVAVGELNELIKEAVK